jgi:hypothetical protein
MSKASEARELKARGSSTSEIAKALGISHQHARNASNSPAPKSQITSAARRPETSTTTAGVRAVVDVPQMRYGVEVEYTRSKKS